MSEDTVTQAGVSVSIASSPRTVVVDTTELDRLRAENAALREKLDAANWLEYDSAYQFEGEIKRLRLDLATCHAALRWIMLHRDGVCDGDGCWEEHRDWAEWCD